MIREQIVRYAVIRLAVLNAALYTLLFTRHNPSSELNTMTTSTFHLTNRASLAQSLSMSVRRSLADMPVVMGRSPDGRRN